MFTWATDLPVQYAHLYIKFSVIIYCSVCIYVNTATYQKKKKKNVNAAYANLQELSQVGC